jgi:hypothetical protein
MLASASWSRVVRSVLYFGISDLVLLWYASDDLFCGHTRFAVAGSAAQIVDKLDNAVLPIPAVSVHRIIGLLLQTLAAIISVGETLMTMLAMIRRK